MTGARVRWAAVLPVREQDPVASVVAYARPMSEVGDDPRSANLLGALALVVSRSVEACVTTVTGRPAADVRALVLMTTVLGGRSQEAVARALGLTQSGTVRLVDRLER